MQQYDGKNQVVFGDVGRTRKAYLLASTTIGLAPVSGELAAHTGVNGNGGSICEVVGDGEKAHLKDPNQHPVSDYGKVPMGAVPRDPYVVGRKESLLRIGKGKQ